MEWWQIIVLIIIIYIAYSAGHWVGYGKGEQDTRELTEEIRKLNKKNSRHLRWTIKAKPYRARQFRRTQTHKLNTRDENRFSADQVAYKTITRR